MAVMVEHGIMVHSFLLGQPILQEMSYLLLLIWTMEKFGGQKMELGLGAVIQQQAQVNNIVVLQEQYLLFMELIIMIVKQQ